ncbi:Dna2/Cas4 domain-containing protein [Candidatus Woesearchaeota archaeon]|nr:Dna2/Cas4 domain-containing protein [Candidatus Woesearchaeota archaeon]
MSITVTALCSFEYCARKFYMTNVLKLVEPPKEAMVKGSVRHSALEELNNNEPRIVRSITTLDEDSIKQTYKTVVSDAIVRSIKHNKSQMDALSMDRNTLFEESINILSRYANDRAENVISFIKQKNIFGSELWEQLTPKIKSEINLHSENLGMHGRIDEIREYETFRIPVELKTGSAPTDGVWPSHRIQIAAYCMMMGVSYGIVSYLDYRIYRKIALNPFIEDSVISLRNKVNETLISDRIPDKTNNENKCRSCVLRKECNDLLR